MRYLTHTIIVGLMGALMSCSGEQGEPGQNGLAGGNGNPGDKGDPGSAGAPALTKITDEAAGANCADGGKKIEVGTDKNGNGTLDADEVTGTASYICNGSGKSSLVATSVEPAGANCPFGGVKIETGLDANGDKKLDPAEVIATATTYACNTAPSGSISPSTGINVTVKAVSTATTGPITVRFTMKDDRGFPLDTKGKYSQNTAIEPRFALAYFTKDSAGTVSPLKVYTKSARTTTPTVFSPTAFNPVTAGQGTLTENGSGAGDYTYSFPTTATTGGAAAVAYDATKLGETHVVWVQVSRQTDEVFTTNANTFYATNQDYYYVPSGGTPAKREIVTAANCNKCHSSFKPETTTSNAFHGGGRVNPLFCNVCHNPDRTSNPKADSASFIHAIHRGSKIAPADRFDGLAATYPQDIRNCGGCHKGAAQEAQSKTKVSRLICTSCHANVMFDGSAGSTSAAKCTNPPTLGTDGIPVKCNHQMGVMTDDTTCSTACHTAAKIAEVHTPVVPPNPGNAWLTGSTGTGGAAGRLNAAYLAAAGYVPTGANVITYDVKSVDAVVDATDATIKHPTITFKLKKDGTDVVFQTYAAGTVTEMMPNFIGAPSIQFAWAVPQDGIAKPVDFNASASVYLRAVWNQTITETTSPTKAKLEGPDSTGYYKLTLLSAVLKSDAVQLTGGVGYSYSIGTSNADPASTVPLTQTNVTGYAYDGSTAGKGQGGIIVPIPNVWKAATGYTARRPIVDAAKCNNCHGTLGVAPTFHVGQRNDGPTCSFCHTANRPSSGWSAGSKYAFHALHAGRKRTVPYTWYAASATESFAEVEFPSTLNKCTNCHAPNTYDYTASANAASLPNQLFATAATGLIDPASATYYRYSPYVTSSTNYGAGFSFSAATGVATQAAGTTLVISPITTACSSCHDSPTAIDHMKGNGGHFYEPRSTALDPAAPKEQCMMCHGPGRVAAIGAVHQK